MVDELPERARSDRERDELFRFLVESATDYAISSADPNRRITTWNSGSERLMGWSETEIVGRSADIIFTPEDRGSGAPATEVTKALTEGRAENTLAHA